MAFIAENPTHSDSQTFAQWLRTALSGITRRMQVARMEGVLYGMSDRQLADVGIRRNEIPKLARKLVIDER